MPLTASRRRELLAASHPLRPVAVLPAGELTEAHVAHVRACLAAQTLAKVRIDADDNAACDALGADLAARVPCELVRRVGRVLILYREPQAD